MLKITQEQFIEKVSKSNKYYENYFTIIGSYISGRDKIEVDTIFGKCKVKAENLWRKGNKSSILSAVNKTNFFINQAKSIHSNNYKYDKTIYINSITKVIITCKEHGDIEITPNSHLQGRGCRECSDAIVSSWNCDNWVSTANKSNKFDSFKLYIVKLFDNKEEFYKVGITFQKMLNRMDKIPYNYKLISCIEDTPEQLLIKEKQIKDNNTKNRYFPNKKFGGSKYECFKNIPYGL